MSNFQENAAQGEPEQQAVRFVPEAQTSQNTSLGAGINIGSVISRAFAILMKNPSVFFGLSLAVTIPPAIIGALSPAESAMNIVTQVLQALLGCAVQGAIAYTVYQVMSNKAVSIGDAATRGVARIVPLILTSLLAGLGIVLGSMLLIIPGIILMCMWFVAMPACAVEKIGPVESLQRSAHLTKGCRMQIFGLTLLIGAFSVITALLVAFIGNLGGAIISVVPQAFISVLYAIVYFDLRVLKEGVSLGSLTGVFD